MKESILDVLLYLFEHYLAEDADLARDHDALRSGPLLEELGQAGFSPAEINKAFEWLDALAAPAVKPRHRTRQRPHPRLLRPGAGQAGRRLPRLPAVPGAARHPGCRPARAGARPRHGAGPGRNRPGRPQVGLADGAVKESYGNIFACVDAGTYNTVPRPAIYLSAHHEIINAGQVDGQSRARITVAGNLCETGYVFGRERSMPLPECASILAVLGAGAYCRSMASNFNLRDIPREVLI